jgi:phenylalanyl-tRNA synthetase alpha chain
MQVLLTEVVAALEREWRCEVRWHRAHPVVSVEDNYDALGYLRDGAARDERYTRYVSQHTLLRTQTSAMIPPLLRELADGADVLLVCPGLVYRRDTIDRLHTGEPHQVDLWRIGEGTLLRMVEVVITAALPGRPWRVTPAEHPYTREGLQLDVREGDDWVEVGECGLANVPRAKGLAMGLGLDRLLMLRKGIPDIRWLRSEDPRVTAQLRDLSPWRAVSRMPAVVRDLSVATREASAETLGDQVREALGASAVLVESIEILSVTPASGVPPVARARLGMTAEQQNVLLRLVLRAIDRSLTHAECNELRDRVYLALHQGA